MGKKLDAIVFAVSAVSFIVLILVVSFLGSVVALWKFEEDQEIDDYEFLREATNRFIASQEYKLNGTDKYTCKDYARDYYKIMKSMGYNVNITGGCNETDCHLWNTIEMEPQRGFMKKNKYTLPLGPKSKKLVLSLMEE